MYFFPHKEDFNLSFSFGTNQNSILSMCVYRFALSRRPLDQKREKMYRVKRKQVGHDELPVYVSE